MRLDGDSGRDRAYQYLRTRVLTDPAKLGTFINEQAIASVVGVSRTPVREALLMLAAEDLVQLVPNRGAFIAPVPSRQIAEMMQARGLIECWAAATCLESGSAPVEAMQSALDRQTAMMVTGAAQEFIELDREFHVLLVDAAGNSVLDRLYETLRARHVLLGVAALEHSGTRREEVIAEHDAIVKALRAGDREASEHAIRQHLDSTRDLLIHG